MWITRFVVVVSFLALGLVVSPDLLVSRLKDAGGWPVSNSGGIALKGSLAYLRFVHLLSFATAWGTSLWVTLIGGILMFRNLPRHQFGNLQSKLFPVYFRLQAVCAAICVAAFSTLHPWSSSSSADKTQILSLSCSLIATMLNLVIFEPLTIKVMKQRHKIERDESIGNEIGSGKNQEVAKRNPELAKINKTFGMVHGLSSLSNLLSIGGFAIHSWYLACRVIL